MAHSTSETAFLTLVKSFTYRGNREEWSNAYHWDNVPPDSGVWGTLQQEVWTREANFLPVDVQLETVLGHLPGTPPILVYEGDVAPPGQGGVPGVWVPTANDHPCPGDSAGWVRYGTTQKSKLGKPIYLRNYYHAMYYTANPDTITTQQRNLMMELGQALVDGVQASGVTYHRAGPRGAVAQNHSASTYVTTRTLKHRGRRRAKLPAGSTVQLPSIVIE